jgi:hypothetical protein
MNYVYWIHSSSCTDHRKDGYVGVTNNPTKRYSTHIRKGRVPIDSTISILFEGTREQCFNYEKEMRPHKNIGWNNAAGGSHGWKTGFSHSDQAKEKMSTAWSSDRKEKASEFKREHNRSLRGQRRPKQSQSMTGPNNPMFGTIRPDHVKRAVSDAHRGKTPVNKQELYCVRCHERASLSILKKYHNKCELK